MVIKYTLFLGTVISTQCVPCVFMNVMQHTQERYTWSMPYVAVYAFLTVFYTR